MSLDLCDHLLTHESAVSRIANEQSSTKRGSALIDVRLQGYSYRKPVPLSQLAQT